MIEVLVRERDQLREGAEMLIKKVERIRTCSDGDGSVEEGDFSKIIIFTSLAAELVLLAEMGEPILRKKGEVPQLLWVAGDEGAFAAIENGQGRSEIALGGFVDDDEVEEGGLKREDAMNVVSGGDPDGEVVDESFEVEVE